MEFQEGITMAKKHSHSTVRIAFGDHLLKPELCEEDIGLQTTVTNAMRTHRGRHFPFWFCAHCFCLCAKQLWPPLPLRKVRLAMIDMGSLAFVFASLMFSLPSHCKCLCTCVQYHSLSQYLSEGKRVWQHRSMQ